MDALVNFAWQISIIFCLLVIESRTELDDNWPRNEKCAAYILIAAYRYRETDENISIRKSRALYSRYVIASFSGSEDEVRK